jgi:hypothetical protein
LSIAILVRNAVPYGAVSVVEIAKDPGPFPLSKEKLEILALVTTPGDEFIPSCLKSIF